MKRKPLYSTQILNEGEIIDVSVLLVFTLFSLWLEMHFMSNICLQ